MGRTCGFSLAAPHQAVTGTLREELGWKQPPGLAGRPATHQGSSWRRSLPVKTQGGLSFPCEDGFADGSRVAPARGGSPPGQGRELGWSGRVF